MTADAVLDRLAVKIGAREGRGRDADLARELGVDPKLITTWRRRETFDHDLVIAFARARGISLDWLFGEPGAIAAPSLPFEVDPTLAAALQAPPLNPGDALGQLRVLNELQAGVISRMEEWAKG